MEQPQNCLLLGNAKGVEGLKGMSAYLWVEVGIAEQNLVSISAGLAKTGKKTRLSIQGQNA
ncbi:MAG: hypothetical protein LIO95_01995 [Clostridiales bacterium]|nr:hypothetical protein [Clostridiales bacterium]